LQALLVRAHRLGTISDRNYQHAFRHLSRQGWRRNEPLNLGAPEEPQLIERAFALLAKKGVAPEDVLRSVGLPDALARLSGNNFEGRPDAPVVPLKPAPRAVPAVRSDA